MSDFGFIEIVWGWTQDEIDARQDHLWERHRLAAGEIEEALLDDAPRHWPNRNDQPPHRRMAVGRTRGGRWLQIVLQVASADDDVWRIITAWPANQNWVDLHQRSTRRRGR
jgi:uncharacterized DUF497 family protein